MPEIVTSAIFDLAQQRREFPSAELAKLKKERPLKGAMRTLQDIQNSIDNQLGKKSQASKTALLNSPSLMQPSTSDLVPSFNPGQSGKRKKPKRTKQIKLVK